MIRNCIHTSVLHCTGTVVVNLHVFRLKQEYRYCTLVLVLACPARAPFWLDIWLSPLWCAQNIMSLHFLTATLGIQNMCPELLNHDVTRTYDITTSSCPINNTCLVHSAKDFRIVGISIFTSPNYALSFVHIDGWDFAGETWRQYMSGRQAQGTCTPRTLQPADKSCHVINHILEYMLISGQK